MKISDDRRRNDLQLWMVAAEVMDSSGMGDGTKGEDDVIILWVIIHTPAIHDGAKEIARYFGRARTPTTALPESGISHLNITFIEF